MPPSNGPDMSVWIHVDSVWVLLVPLSSTVPARAGGVARRIYCGDEVLARPPATASDPGPRAIRLSGGGLLISEVMGRKSERIRLRQT